MSRIGKLPITIPAGTEVTIGQDEVTVKGKLGTLTTKYNPVIEIKKEGNTITLTRSSDEKTVRALHGLYRALIANMVTGVTQGFEKQLELVGVGYRANATGQLLDLSLGYSHNIVIELPKEIKVETINEKGKNPIIKLQSHDKQLLGMVCAKIRSFRRPEPYKGKGIRFVGEIVRRKAGKTASKGKK
ncbi:50S ribosomal protein L6 [Thermaurantimonas aggregans]|uniref:Large ribosomal subunit protein uL6 n=1 Tax=Thermaurantimonas aggregans TaxID=2173829 RepID=A0A401XN63_9FLAO|nr:50S ribosomal protein L6 [Thermaurantimonas aggregans]MCX8149577.1 50S ribosomal protein L6 [Thermaurantimonas aggregans]GCD78445.1 50S ribosomal protein L6 [Thermaurantimonas aggregans]